MFTGIIEGLGKVVRLTMKGADALLPFRVAYMSGRYDELWRHIIGDRKQVRIA